jgi:hypothetical protein
MLVEKLSDEKSRRKGDMRNFNEKCISTYMRLTPNRR